MFIKKLSKTLFVSFLFIFISVNFLFAQGKKNSRPNEDLTDETNTATKVQTKDFDYAYEFSQPDFLVSKVIIEHNMDGEGRITFQKRDYEEDFVEPVKLSEKSINTFKKLWAELDFLRSDEIYQSKDKDYGHLGTIKLKVKEDSKERIAEFNWTENAKAKALADEYRKITNQYVWVFDMNIARANQPLESPRIMKRFDQHLKRNEISDPKQLMPYLKEISDDERVPLITRNYATRLLKRIEKIKEDKAEEIPN